MKLVFLSVTFLISIFCLAQGNTITLKPGDKAPKLMVQKWLKGNPVSTFQKDHIYIIDFGSVSCAPCRVAIPHLTDLAKKYKDKVIIISFFIRENSKTDTSKSYVARVENFINKMGSKIGYSVAVDVPSQTTADAWMTAAGKSAIPQAFVVNQVGNIVWMGSPMEVDDVIEQVLAGNTNFKSQQSVLEEQRALFRKIQSWLKSKEYDSVIYEYDKLIKDNPNVYAAKFEVLLRKNENTAYTYGWKLLKDECEDIEPVLQKMAHSMVDLQFKLNKPDLELGLALSKRALELSKDEFNSSIILNDLAFFYFKQGKTKKAIETQEKAIKYLLVYPDKSKGYIKIFEENLITYKKNK